MSLPVTIRTAQVQDASTVARLVSILGDDLRDPSAITTGYAGEVLRTNRCHVLLAERDGRILGMVSYHFQPSLYHAADSCLIDELVIEPAARGQGAGGMLLEEALRLARDRGCAEVGLSVMTTNEGARRFYAAHGFEADAVYMERHFGAE